MMIVVDDLTQPMQNIKYVGKACWYVADDCCKAMEKNRGETSSDRVGKQRLQKSVSMCHYTPHRSVELRAGPSIFVA